MTQVGRVRGTGESRMRSTRYRVRSLIMRANRYLCVFTAIVFLALPYSLHSEEQAEARLLAEAKKAFRSPNGSCTLSCQKKNKRELGAVGIQLDANTVAEYCQCSCARVADYITSSDIRDLLKSRPNVPASVQEKMEKAGYECGAILSERAFRQ